MKWTNDRSENVDDRRGSGGGGGLLVGGGLGTLIIAAIIFFLGGDPSAILSSGMGSSGAQTEQRDLTPDELKVRDFVSMITKENEQTWSKIFQENGMQYRDPKVVMFESVTQSGCGTAQAAMGRFIVLQTKPFIWT